MNKFFLMLIGFVFTLQAVHSEELFLKGNQHFLQAEFSQAVDVYQQVKNPSSLVLMNMGVAYFNMKDYAQAQLAFVKAAKNSEGSLYRRIKLLQNKLDEHLNFEVHKGIQARLIDVVHFLPAVLLQLWVLICFLMILYCIFRKKTGTFQLIFYILFSFGALGSVYRYRLSQGKVAVVMVDTYLHAGPDLLFLKKNMVPLGKVLRVLSERDEMVYVVLDKQQGWVSSKDLTLV